MNRFLRNRLLELLKAIVFLALGSYLGALYATHELLPANRQIGRRVTDRNGDFQFQRSSAFLTVFVVSAPDNNEKRDILRRTWLGSQKLKLRKGLAFHITSCFRTLRQVIRVRSAGMHLQVCYRHGAAFWKCDSRFDKRRHASAARS